MSRDNYKKALSCNSQNIVLTDKTGNDNQIWKIENTFNGLLKISNKQFPDMTMAINGDMIKGNKASVIKSGTGIGWALMEVCESKQEAFKSHVIPGTIEAEDYNSGCLGDAYFDTGETNTGGKYRRNESVDIDTCSTGGYLVGWTSKGEWMAYTVNVSKSSSYEVSFYVASPSDNAKLHLERNGKDLTGTFSVPNTKGYQNMGTVKKTIKLDAGRQILKLYIDSPGLNIDKFVFAKTGN